MSTTIRLSLLGKKNQRTYRIVVTEIRTKRNGKCLEQIGSYNPTVKPPTLQINQQKLNDWQARGASISEGLRKILKKQIENY